MSPIYRLAFISSLAIAFMLLFIPGAAHCAPSIAIEPATSFTARLIGGSNVIVGAPAGTEGTAYKSTFLDIKEGTSDRTILEYDVRGLPVAEAVFLNLELTNLDVPDFNAISLYSFTGNGLANASDYFKTTSLITTFTDNGLATNFVPPYHIPFSLNVTSAFNSAVARGDSYLGLLLKNTPGPRYRLTTFGGLPKLSVTVPEPSTLLLAAVGLPFLFCRRR